MGCCLFCVSSTDESSSFLQPFGPTVTWLPDSPSVGYSMGSQFFLIGSSFHPNGTSPDWVQQGLHHMDCHQLGNRWLWLMVITVLPLRLEIGSGVFKDFQEVLISQM